MIHREECQKIRNDAEEASCEGISPLWKRAYLRLADAADNLDAMIARTEVTPEEEVKPG